MVMHGSVALITKREKLRGRKFTFSPHYRFLWPIEKVPAGKIGALFPRYEVNL